MDKKTFIVETSARHVHLSEKDMQTLFGEGAKLTFKRPLSQPGQFLSEERVDIQGGKSTMKNVAILGPERPASQVEISMTDSYALGVAPVVRESGDISGTPGLTLIGPKGSVEISEGVIVAKRHIHMTPEDAAAFGVEDKQIVSVAVDAARPLTFGDVVVRVSPNFALAMHVDTDESNAAGIPRDGAQGCLA